MIALLIFLATRTYNATLPNSLTRHECGVGDTVATSWMVPELWCQPRRSLWAPTDWRVWAAEWRPFLVALGPDAPPGSRISITVPDTLPYGTAWLQVRNEAGESCPSNYVESKR